MQDLFDDLPILEPAKQTLRNYLESGKVPHALLFYAGCYELAQKSAYRFAASLLSCPIEKVRTHPDLYQAVIEGKGAIHSVESVRALIERACETPFSASCKVCVIEHAELLPVASQNILLKTLEEPPLESYIFLVTDHKTSLLKTTLSRVQVLTLGIDQRHRSPFLEVLVPFLTHGKFRSIQEYKALVLKLKEMIEVKESEESVDPHLTPYFKELVKKQGEAQTSLLQRDRYDLFLASLLSFSRDLVMMKEYGDPSLLMNTKIQHILREKAKLSESPKLDQISSLIEQNRELYRRNTSLQICLENLLLKIHELH